MQVGKEGRADLGKTVKEMNRQFGEGAVMRLGDMNHLEVQVLSTGSLAVDLALGIGGLPRGRICEIFGPESSGKTTFCLCCIASVQRSGGVAAFIDVEHALDPSYAKVVGAHLEDLLVSQPESGEVALRIAEGLIRSGAVDLVVVDSVAALAVRAELDGEIGDAIVGAQARLMGQALRHLTGATAKTQAICLFTNQIRSKIGTSYGNPETTPGGNALKFAASIRLDIRRVGTLKDGDGRIIGNRTRVKVVKNKVASPFVECEFDILFAEGISHTGSLVDIGIALEILSQRGAWIAFGDQLLGQGRQAARTALQENSALMANLEEHIREKISVASR